jgi:hypothetical protein
VRLRRGANYFGFSASSARRAVKLWKTPANCPDISDCRATFQGAFRSFATRLALRWSTCVHFIGGTKSATATDKGATSAMCPTVPSGTVR